MAVSKESLVGTEPITAEERSQLQEAIRGALADADFGVFSADVVGEPNREGDSDYAIAIIKKQGM